MSSTTPGARLAIFLRSTGFRGMTGPVKVSHHQPVNGRQDAHRSLRIYT